MYMMRIDGVTEWRGEGYTVKKTCFNNNNNDDDEKNKTRKKKT